jgi:hypothetical protein
VIRLIFDQQQGGDGLIFDVPVQQVKPAPATSGSQYQQRPAQQPQHRPIKECTWRTK